MPQLPHLLIGLALALPLAPASAQVFSEGQVAALTGVDDSDFLGSAVDVSGPRAISGAYNHELGATGAVGGAWILERSSVGTWQLAADLAPSNPVAFMRFGSAVGIDGDYAVVAAEREGTLGSNAGAAYVFERQADGTWIEVQKLLPADGEIGWEFGVSADLSNGRIVIGAPRAKGDATTSRIGAAYVYERQPGGTWAQTAKLEATDFQSNDEFGADVSIDGDLIAVGSPLDDDNGSTSGSGYLFRRAGDGSWAQLAKLLPGDGASTDNAGASVAVTQGVAVVGSVFDDDLGSGSGSAYVFEEQPDGSWIETQKLLHPDGSGGDRFGYDVAADAGAILVGAFFDTVGFKIRAGSAHLFTRQLDGTWAHSEEIVLEQFTDEDKLGSAVGLSGGWVHLGALGSDVQGSDSGDSYLYYAIYGDAAPVAGGTGTPGCSGSHDLSALGTPLLGNLGFGLTCSNAPSDGFGYLLVGGAADLVGNDLLGLGVLLHIDLLQSPNFFLQPILSDGTGANFIPAPLPDLPLLAGATFHAQASWFWTSCSPSPLGLSTSRLLSLTLQPGS